MRFRYSTAFLVALYIANAPGAHAEQTSDIRLLPQDSRILSYVLGNIAINNLISIGKRVDSAIGVECTDEYRMLDLSPSSVVVMEPIDFPDASAYPTAGAWQYRFDLTRCKSTKTYNAFAMSQSGAAPRFGALIPGKTIGSALLLRDTQQTVFMKLAFDEKMKRQRECKDIIIKDTRVSVAPKIVTTASGPQVTGSYEEEWLARACGAELAVPICFTAKPDGGTSFRVEACKNTQ